MKKYPFFGDCFGLVQLLLHPTWVRQEELDVENKGHIATIILMAQSKDSITSILLSLNGGGL